MKTLLVVGVALLATSGSLAAQATSVFATKVIASNTNNKAGGGVFNTKNALGGPRGKGAGQGSSHVHSLGTGGSLTLGFAVTITDGPGADLIVFENPFLSSVGRSFSELAFVEVSSDGKNFARFPTSWSGSTTGKGNFSTSAVTDMRGLAGVTPVYADVSSTGGPDPLDVGSAGGEAFDLALLKNDVLVKAGKVKLAAITQVRLVDVVSGKSKDSKGTTIHDDGSGSADIDAVAVIHHTGNQSANAPRVDLALPANGQLSITLSDPNGTADLDLAKVQLTLNSQPLSVFALLPFFVPTRATSTSVTFTLVSGVPKGFRYRFSLSVKDKAGHRSGATVVHM